MGPDYVAASTREWNGMPKFGKCVGRSLESGNKSWGAGHDEPIVSLPLQSCPVSIEGLSILGMIESRMWEGESWGHADIRKTRIDEVMMQDAGYASTLNL